MADMRFVVVSDLVHWCAGPDPR